MIDIVIVGTVGPRRRLQQEPVVGIPACSGADHVSSMAPTERPATLSTEARAQAKAIAQAALDAAARALADGSIDRAAWHERVTGAMSSVYLADEADPRWQSGFDGDADAWREARELVLDGVSEDGTFLDIGCANGHLMESLEAWAAERGRHLVLYGLEIDRNLAAAARRRLPEWADRIFLGNALDWEPEMAFTYVRTGLEYVPEDRQAFFVERLLRDLVEPRGRLIIGPASEREIAHAFEVVKPTRPAVFRSTDRVGKTRAIICLDKTEA
jgi:hypothetical protein